MPEQYLSVTHAMSYSFIVRVLEREVNLLFLNFILVYIYKMMMMMMMMHIS